MRDGTLASQPLILNKQSADELGICERTVKIHRTSIKKKVGVQSVAES
jgi:FixJ family two-component response regulator